MGSTVVIIPTYDEKENVGPIAEAVGAAAPDVDILFVDGNSPDGTGRIIDELVAKNDHIHVLHQAGKEGLGRTYIAGFHWALERGYDFIFEMDADFSHDPNEIPNFLREIETADLVLGSRYIGGIRISNWPLSRLILSKSAGTYVRFITGLPFTDPTGGFKCFRRRFLEAIDLGSIKANGYSFQIEVTHKGWLKGFRITEIPITFEDRHSGYSKMNKAIIREALWIVWRLSIQCGFRRRPKALQPPPDAATS